MDQLNHFRMPKVGDAFPSIKVLARIVGLTKTKALFQYEWNKIVYVVEQACNFETHTPFLGDVVQGVVSLTDDGRPVIQVSEWACGQATKT